MVATEFFDYLTKYHVTDYVGLEDFSDKFNFIYTVSILGICMIVITVKTYLLKPLSCYIATPFDGKNFGDYIDNFCWVEGTVAQNVSGSLPLGADKWDYFKDKKLAYYQWVPFVLGLQCVLFYFPKIIWEMVTYNRTGTDLQNIIQMSNTASQSDAVSRADKVKHIAKQLEEIFFKYRDFRTGKRAVIRRKLYNICSFAVIGKRMGTWLIFCYMFIKVLYLVNSIGQLFLMERFLGFEKNYTYFGYRLATNMIAGIDWHQSNIFPRVTFCPVKLQHVGAVNQIVAQCVLPINMLNEKLYIFLWFWILCSAILTSISIPLWFLRIGYKKNQSHFIKKFLTINEHYTKQDKPIVNSFMQQFLRHDGIFLLRMIALNAGDLVASDIIIELWNLWHQKYHNRDFRKDVLDDPSLSLALKLGKSGMPVGSSASSQGNSTPNTKLLSKENEF